MSDSRGRVDAGADAERRDGASVPTGLLGEGVETFERVLTGRSPGPLAVCGPPFGGRERVLERAADRLGTDLLRLGPGDGAEPLLSALGDGPVVVDGCQHLYERRIGGFEPLDRVLRAVVECDGVVVTGWNSYAWTYLARVRGIDRTFAARTEIEPTAAADLAALVLERYDEVPAFAPDEADPDGLFASRRYVIGWRGHGLSVSVPVPNRAAVTASLADDNVDPQDVVFERLAAISKGNVGVATAIWEASRRDERRPSDIVASGTDLDLDREEAFCLRIVLLKERVERGELTRIVDDTERVLGRLLRDGVVSTADGVVQLEPTAVPTAVTETERRGLH
ncbi:MAG: hypothetical protein ABEH78_02570 [Haloferacaceae archaeon]